MNLSKKLLQPLKVIAVTLAFSLFFLSQNAIAQISIPPIIRMFEVNIDGGSFHVDVPSKIESNSRVGSAIVSLPKGESGVINKIVITGPDGSREFGCSDIKVQEGTDLIKTCGGPAYLKAGKTTYSAKGSGFSSERTVELGIDLSITPSRAFDPNA